uniref:BTB domain-containing protein n=1 Tax=Mycena chlorophos TaxID=658473 RepID=A0ABQ0L029_MYCCL|nr:predicted protein [Mycena chlorophos]
MDANSSFHESGPLRKADGLYFNDCGLIIRAENVLFRVSGEFLAVNSTFFRDLLSLPQPVDAERLDGCLVARVPDSAEEMTAFLKALLYSSFFESPPAATTFEVLAPILRLSHKYDVPWLHKRALAHLSLTHPTTLSGWENLLSIPNSFIRNSDTSRCLAVISLARDLSLDWVLPVAFYRLARTRSATVIFASDMLMSDKLRWAEAVRKIDTELRSQALDFLWEPKRIAGCTNEPPRLCTEMRAAYRKSVDKVRFSTSPNAGYLMPLETWTAGWWTAMQDTNKVCEVCMGEMKRLKALADETFWQALPEIFDLGTWAELEEQKQAVFTDG